MMTLRWGLAFEHALMSVLLDGVDSAVKVCRGHHVKDSDGIAILTYVTFITIITL